MNDMEKIELAIRRAASQMPGGASRTFRLVADELQDLENRIEDPDALLEYRRQQANLE